MISNTAAAPTSPSSPPVADHSASWILIILSAVVFVSVINGTMINVALPLIGEDFKVSEGVYGWIVTGYALAFGIFNAVHGRLADIFGLRRLYILGVIILGLTSIMVALSPTIEIMIALRVFQGAGSAAIPVLGNAIIARVFPPSKRGHAMGLQLGAVGVAASIGPFLGGLLIEISSWRALFFVTSIVLLTVPIALKLLPKSLDESIPQKFDLIGATFLGFGVTALLLSFNVIESMGFGAVFGGLLALGAFFLGLFTRRIHHAEHPFVHPEVLKNKSFVTTSALAFVSNATRFGTVVLVPIFLIEINNISPMGVGFVLLPGAILIALISPYAGRLGDQIGARKPVAIGMSLIVIGNLVAAYYAGGNVYGVTVGMTLYGMGFAFMQSPLVAAATHDLPTQRQGVGMGIFMMIFFLGGAFGVALSVTAVELQGRHAASWLGLDLGHGAPFSNAILTLTILAIIGLCLVPMLPNTAPEDH